MQKARLGDWLLKRGVLTLTLRTLMPRSATTTNTALARRRKGIMLFPTYVVCTLLVHTTYGFKVVMENGSEANLQVSFEIKTPRQTAGSLFPLKASAAVAITTFNICSLLQLQVSYLSS